MKCDASWSENVLSDGGNSGYKRKSDRLEVHEQTGPWSFTSVNTLVMAARCRSLHAFRFVNDGSNKVKKDDKADAVPCDWEVAAMISVQRPSVS